MNLTSHGPLSRSTGRHVWRTGAVIALSAVAVLAAGCGDKKAKPASQTAAKVNKEEITVHQINFVLQQQRGVPPEQAPVAARQALERLIDQELAVQKAGEMKIDRDPRVVQQLEAARREIIARAYIEKVAVAVQPPTAEEVSKYYNERPARFKDRRAYSLQEVLVEVPPEQLPELRKKLEASKDIAEFVAYLKTNNIKHGGNQAVRTPEQLPDSILDRLSKMKDGESIFSQIRNGAQIVVLAGSRPQPVSEEQARPVIEQTLLNDRKRQLVEEDLKSLRKAADIDYVGEYAKGADQAASQAAGEPLVPSGTASATEPGLPPADPGKAAK